MGGPQGEAIINSVLYETSLVKKLLDTARESATFTLKSTGTPLPSGYMPFVRKIANKLTELQTKNDEVANFLDSIPEWGEFVDSHLKKHNEIESKALGTSKNKQEEEKQSQQDDFFDIMFKLKSASPQDAQDTHLNKDEDDSDSDEE